MDKKHNHAGAGGVRCPGCGAPAGDISAVHCNYCKVVLGKNVCPLCQLRMAPGVSYCPLCGSGTVEYAAESTNLGCPCGLADLSVRSLLVDTRSGSQEALSMAECSECAGVWVSRSTIERLVERHVDDTVLLAMLPGMAAQSASMREALGTATVRYRPCPECKKVMNRVNYARISGIVVDVCRDHGTWFDAHELPAVLDFIRRGGLDSARAREVKELAEERRRLERERMFRHAPEAYRVGSADRQGESASGVLATLAGLFSGL